MTYLHAILLSIIEGITEFLPISSTGHLILASNFLGIPQTNATKSFEIFIQLGAICAVLSLYWRKFFIEKSLMGKIMVSFIPTAIAGFLLYPLIKNILLGSPVIVAWSLIIGGIVLIFTEKLLTKKNGQTTLASLTYKQAFLIGCAQTLSLVPGVSRAGATIVGAMMLGSSRTIAVEYSFFLAIPTMAAAVGWDMVKSAGQFSQNDVVFLAIGFIGSYITALVAIKAFIGFIKNHSFVSFGIYRIVIGTLFLLS